MQISRIAQSPELFDFGFEAFLESTDSATQPGFDFFLLALHLFQVSDDAVRIRDLIRWHCGDSRRNSVSRLQASRDAVHDRGQAHMRWGDSLRDAIIARGCRRSLFASRERGIFE